MPIKKKPAKKKSTKRKPRATMNQSVRQTVIVNQPTATRKRKSKAKPKSKSNNELISSLVDKFVNLSAEQAKINNTITQAKQPVEEPVKLLTSAPVQKTTGMDDLEVKKLKKAEPIDLVLNKIKQTTPLSGIEKIKKATSLLEAQGNILTHLSRKKTPSAPTLSDTIDSVFDEKRVKPNPLRPQQQQQQDIDDIMDQEVVDGYVIF